MAYQDFTVTSTALAVAFAVKVHEGQTDKTGRPYIEHVIRVALRGRTHEERIVGLLHDTIEDGPPGTDKRIVREFPPRIAEAVVALTREPPYGYVEYIERVASFPLARCVKLHDLADHLRNGQEPPGDLRSRYEAATKFLRKVGA